MFYAKNNLATRSSLVLLVLLVLTALISTIGCGDVDSKTENGAETENKKAEGAQKEEYKAEKPFEEFTVGDIQESRKRICKKAFECKLDGTGNRTVDECNEEISGAERKDTEEKLKSSLAELASCDKDECCIVPFMFCFNRCATTMSCDVAEVLADSQGGVDKLKSDPQYADEMKQFIDCTSGCLGTSPYCKGFVKQQLSSSP